MSYNAYSTRPLRLTVPVYTLQLPRPRTKNRSGLALADSGDPALGFGAASTIHTLASDYQNPQVTLRLPDAQKAQKAPRCSVKLCLPRGGNRSSLRPANREGGCCCCCSLQPAGRAAQVNWLSLYEQSSRELRVGCRREAPAWQHILGMDDAMDNDAARQGRARKEGRKEGGLKEEEDNWQSHPRYCVPTA